MGSRFFDKLNKIEKYAIGVTCSREMVLILLKNFSCGKKGEENLG